jgi:hypothetical protein
MGRGMGLKINERSVVDWHWGQQAHCRQLVLPEQEWL